MIAGFGLILYAVGVQFEFQNTGHQNKVDVAKHPSLEFGYVVPYAERCWQCAMRCLSLGVIALQFSTVEPRKSQKALSRKHQPYK
jgi:hypothetical protein